MNSKKGILSRRVITERQSSRRFLLIRENKPKEIARRLREFRQAIIVTAIHENEYAYMLE